MIRGILLFFGLWAGAVGCSLVGSTPEETVPTPTPDYSTAWTVFAPGVEYRTLLTQPSNAARFDMQIVRLDPALVRFRVHYRPGDAYSFSRWQASLQASALVFVNANFFTENYQAIGLVVADGVAAGASLVGYGGMFQVDYEGSVRVRSLVRQPYHGEVYEQVVQSFPMLIEPGGMAASTGDGFDSAARRTVIAQDRGRRILLMTTGYTGEISLSDLQTWLLNSGLDLEVAFALDGGRSSALFVNRPGMRPIIVPSFTDLPTVLAVYGR